MVDADARIPAALSGLPSVGRAVRDCGAVVRAGRRPVGPRVRKSWAPAEELLRGAGFWNR
jgi:hypothetical protein